MISTIVSIVIPSYNKATFIAQTLHSILGQSFNKWEAIVVDDGSTDNSVSIIQSYCRKDDRVKILQRDKKPKGGSACRNIGLAHALGKYVLFLDSDDVLAHDCLENRLQQIGRNPQKDFWVFPIGTFYHKPGDSSSAWIPKGKDFLKKFLNHDLPWHTMSVVWKKEFLQALGGFDVEYPRLQDVELHTRALLLDGVEFETYPLLKVDAYYRIDSKRTSLQPERQLLNQMKGVLMYIEKTTPLLNTKKNKKMIKGTLFTFLNTANYRCIVQTQDQALHQEVWNSIKEFMQSQRVFSIKDIHFLQLYVKLYKTGFWRIKGFNYTMKNIFCL